MFFSNSTSFFSSAILVAASSCMCQNHTNIEPGHHSEVRCKNFKEMGAGVFVWMVFADIYRKRIVKVVIVHGRIV